MSGPTVAQGRTAARDLLAASGVEPLAAAQTAHALVLADAWGVHSHGLLRLPDYLRRLEGGGCNAAAELRRVADTGALVTLDGENGLGHWQLWRAAGLARDRCAEHGVATVAVGRSSHCGALGVYTLPVVEAGLVALVFSHGPAVMPPWNGSSAVVSTSPLAAGIPTHPEPAIVDLATSAVARGRIKVHAQRGEPLPEGWAFTADGEPTIDAKAALDGMLAPLGGAKGFALAFLVEALTAGLVGPALSTDVVDMFSPVDAGRPQQIAHLVLALDPGRLDVEGKGGGERLDRLARAVLAAGGRLPGASRSSRLDDQAPLGVSEQTWRDVREWASRLGVAIG